MIRKLVISLMLLFPATAFCANDQPSQKDFVYLLFDATLNDKPNILADTVEKIKKAEKVEVLEKNDPEWLKVKTNKGNLGWILSRWATKKFSTIKENENIVPSDWGGFRHGPSEKYKKIAIAIENKQWWDLCAEYGRRSRSKNEEYKLPAQAIREFFKSNYAQSDMIRESFLSNIKNEKVVIGMNTCEVYGALGSPESNNTTETSYGKHTQLVYPDNRYIYTEAPPENGGLGIVTAIQH